jgi:hypothetical protein
MRAVSQARAEGDCRGDPQGALRPLPRLVDPGAGQCQLLGHVAHRAVEILAGLGQHQAAGMTVEQGCAELLLERDHLAADRRLAEPERPACAGEAAGLGNRDKDP